MTISPSGPLFDTHCHLDHRKYDGKIDEVLTRAADAGVWRMTTIGCARTLEHVESALQIARAHSDWITTTIGIHPHDAEPPIEEGEVLDEAALRALDDARFAEVERIARDPLVVAIGEMGLDYYDNSPREVQQLAFRRQIALAREVKKPIVIHTREAAEDTLRIMREENAADVGGIIHCFSEGPEFAKAALDMHFVSSFSGIVTFKSAQAIQEAATQQPADAILIETDAPYLAPIPKRGKRNEPAFVSHTADFVAGLRGVDPMELRWTTARNACALFGLTPPA
jgi:TatD DNase family protein